MLTQKEYRKIRIAKAMAAGKCYLCGNPRDDDKKACSACRKKHYDLYGGNRSIPMKEHKPMKKPKYTFDQMCRMAKERGISYGLLVAEMESR